jgi:hypothetical protein
MKSEQAVLPNLCLEEEEEEEIHDAMGRLFLPLVMGDKKFKWTEAPPALCPKMITFLGSPPNLAMFFCTQRRAMTWSF